VSGDEVVWTWIVVVRDLDLEDVSGHGNLRRSGESREEELYLQFLYSQAAGNGVTKWYCLAFFMN
jgi:hypothetical protein